MHKLIILSDNESVGGAATIATNLAKSLSKRNINVTRVVYFKNSINHLCETRSITLSKNEYFLLNQISRISKYFRKKLFNYITHYKLRRILSEIKPDLINVHNLHYAGWDCSLIDVCTYFAPTVWTLHDMWSFTGRCVYSNGCIRFEDYCDHNCPTPYEYPALDPDKIYDSWEKKRDIIRKSKNLSAVSPSKWLESEARKGIWSESNICTINNGLDISVYKPVDRCLAMKKYNLDPTLPTVLAGAHNLTDKRKGYDILINCLESIKTPFNLIAFGKGSISILNKNINMRNVGYITKDTEKAIMYNSADVFLHAAPVDNYPNTIVESISCGTPCVAFPVGGIPEIVIQEVTGWLSRSVNSESLAEALERALNDIKLGNDLRDNCREFSVRNFDLQLQADRYLNLFNKILN